MLTLYAIVPGDTTSVSIFQKLNHGALEGAIPRIQLNQNWKESNFYMYLKPHF